MTSELQGWIKNNNHQRKKQVVNELEKMETKRKSPD